MHVTVKGQGFENITYNAVSVSVIPELLMNMILFHGFVKNTKSADILSCVSKLVDYFTQKSFVIIKTIQMTLRMYLYVWNK